MTPADLRAKATFLISEHRRLAENGGMAIDEAHKSLTAFVDALISVMHEASELTPGPGCMCDKCACYRTALSRLEELTK